VQTHSPSHCVIAALSCCSYALPPQQLDGLNNVLVAGVVASFAVSSKITGARAAQGQLLDLTGSAIHHNAGPQFTTTFFPE
jgi:hypothetical protein